MGAGKTTEKPLKDLPWNQQYTGSSCMTLTIMILIFMNSIGAPPDNRRPTKRPQQSRPQSERNARTGAADRRRMGGASSTGRPNEQVPSMKIVP